MRKVAWGLALAMATSTSVWAREVQDDAFGAYEDGRYVEAARGAEAALASDPENPNWWALAAEARARLGQNRDAADAFSHAAKFETDPEKRGYYLRAQTLSLVGAGLVEEARAVLAQADADPGLDIDHSLDWAMVAIATGDDATAQRILDDKNLHASFTRQPALDAAYSAKRRGMDDRATTLFATGLALDESEPEPLDEAQREHIRREVRELRRRWAIAGQASYSSSGRPDGIAPLGDQEVLQSGLEFSRRIGGWRNGRPFNLFVRAFHSEFLGDDAIIGNAMQGWVGARYKPFSKVNLNIEGSRLVGLDAQGLEDWSLRGAFSASEGVEPELGRSNWSYLHVYSDVSYLFENEVTYGIAEARYGRAFSIGDGMSLTPYAVARADIDTGRIEEGSLGAGAGLSIRFHFDETDTVAHRGWVDFDVQLRERIAGDVSAGGVLASISLSR
ncbi:bacteriophage N4 adsorption protein A [Qipengyuania vesicularis]|uniref:bacteriophage N4 adsorption protein A n=1 Tax=Qipengyuania vesicularis TaxID=2867232 RepID=UPI001C87894E|nr:bacteriophage N4 adsorption protein A [Qipengyuania vesicularis]MBX7528070.1 bacteriophage N4 adsorption protein A [Qipengyuania vesicularis]